MTDTFAKSALPPRTAHAWCDKTHIIVEFPTKDGPPYITRFRKTTEGLQQALNILIEQPAPSGKHSFDHPTVKKLASAPLVSPEAKAEAASIVRRLLKI